MTDYTKLIELQLKKYSKVAADNSDSDGIDLLQGDPGGQDAADAAASIFSSSAVGFYATQYWGPFTPVVGAATGAYSIGAIGFYKAGFSGQFAQVAGAATDATSSGAADVSAAQNTGELTQVTVSSAGGMTINLEFVNQDHPTANFEADVENAALLLSKAIHNNITVNLQIWYGELNGKPLTNGQAAAYPDYGLYEPYSTIRDDLLQAEPAGDPNISDFTNLPISASIQGDAEVTVWSGELKALGLISATNSAIDGDAGFAVGIPDSLMVGLALHELTHALGRVPNFGGDIDVFDFSHFTSPGWRSNYAGTPAPAAYFSVDGGVTSLASYGISSDPSDFLNSSVPEDPLDEYYDDNTIQSLTQLDLTQLDVLGFDVWNPQVVVNVQDVLVAEDDSISESAFFTGLTNPSGDNITDYRFEDVGTNGNLTLNGVAELDGQWVYASPNNLSSVAYVGGSSPGADTLYVDAYDATTSSWVGALLSATTTAPVVVNVQNVSVAENASISESAFFTGLTNPSGDDIAYYYFEDAGTNGYLTVNGVAQPDGQWVYVSPDNLSSVAYVGGSSPGTDTLYVDAYDATTSSWVDASLTATTLAAQVAYDFNGAGLSDILWRNTNGDTAIWISNGSGGFSNYYDLGVVPTSWQIAGVGDLTGDGKSDILWSNTDGDTALWISNGSGGFSDLDLGIVPTSWQIAGVGDFTGDGLSDILWRNTDGDTALWISNGSGGFSNYDDLGVVPTSWQIAGVGDFTGDGKSDILWRNTDGDTALWISNGSGGFSNYDDLGVVPTSWQIAGVGDFNGNGMSDILWRNTDGDTALWISNGSGGFSNYYDLGVVPTSWQIAGVGDLNGDGKSDILWSNSNGDAALWESNGSGGFSYSNLGVVPSSWKIQGG